MSFVSSEEDTVAPGGSLVRDVVRAVVTKVAPEELPVVAGLAEFDDATVVRRLGRRRQAREPLGFGVGELVVVVTPVVWLVVDQAAKKIAGAAVDGTAKGARAVLRRLFRRRSAPVVVPPLTREQLREVRQQVLEATWERGLSDKRATAVADAVVARLALGESGSAAEGPEGTAKRSE